MKIGFGTLIHWLAIRLMHNKQTKVRTLDVARAIWGLSQVGVTNEAILGALLHQMPSRDWLHIPALETAMLVVGCGTAKGACFRIECVHLPRFKDTWKQVHLF